MKYQNLLPLSDAQFRRATGVTRKTFKHMVKILQIAEALKKAQGGRPSKLCMEDKLCMALEYLREYRTYLHISVNYGISESNTFTTIKWVENTLIADGTFSLPGKKALQESDNEFEIILIDATETPIQRPKKTKN